MVLKCISVALLSTMVFSSNFNAAQMMLDEVDAIKKAEKIEKERAHVKVERQIQEVARKVEAQKEYVRYLNVPVEKDTSFKAYMDYRCITSTGSKQWEMQQQAYTDMNGVRKIGDNYCAAIGTGYNGELGDVFEITLSTGAKFNIILADIKADVHTDMTNRYTEMSGDRANVIEFIVQDECLPSIVTTMGNLDYMPGDIFKGNIVSMKEVL